MMVEILLKKHLDPNKDTRCLTHLIAEIISKIIPNTNPIINR